MSGGIWMRLGVLAAAVAAVFAAPVAAQTVPRIVAVGDLHGDFNAWRDIARGAGLIDAKGHWAGGTTILVQAGDVADRGPDTLKIIDELMQLQREAPRAGGKVYVLVGNHEAMNITDDLRYVSAGEVAAFATRNSAALRDRVYDANRVAIEAAYRTDNPAMTSEAIRAAWYATMPRGMLEHQAAWVPTGRIGSWVIGNPAVVLIDGTLFVHGGLSAVYAARPIADINRAVAAALTARETAPDAIINDPLGPLWYRGLVAPDAALTAEKTPAEKTQEAPGGTPAAPAAAPVPGAAAGPAAAAAPAMSIETELAAVLAAYGAKRMVIAHTPILSGIAILYDGRLVRIDTGISAVYGGKVSYLEIIDGRLEPHVVPRSPPTGAK
jgi:hypothetical protein